MKEQKETTSEDYLDSLLNSIINGENSGSDSLDADLFDDSNSTSEDVSEEDFFGNIEDELFGSSSEEGTSTIEDEDYFDKEISDEELFGLDDDIMSAIEEEPKKEEEPVEEAAESVEEAIAANDSAVDDNLQGLLDVMGIEEKLEEEEQPKGKKKKEKKKLFGRKKKKKASKDDVSDESTDNAESEGLVDLSALSGMMGGLSEVKGDNANELDFGGIDETSVDSAVSPIDGGLEGLGNFDFDMSGDDDSLGETSGFGDLPDLDSPDEPVKRTGGLGSYMDDDELDEDDDPKKKGKKNKKKKEKKPKTKKVKTKDPKKGVNAKKKKEKKEKKEKEPDEIIHISKGFIAFAFTVAFVFIFTLIFGGDYYTYNKKMSDATKEYVNKNYTVAYDKLFGLEMKKEDDKELFNQVQTIMFVNRHYEAYESLIRMDEYEQGLYSLLKGVKMFDKYQNEGRKLNCYDDMQTVLGWIDRGLLETYGITESEARELNLLNNDDKLAYEVALIAQDAREKSEAAKKAAEEAAKAEESVTE